jgi:dipeptide/tripeptide permease
MKHNYRRLLVMAIISFIAMYILMYAMVDRLDNVIPNLNQFYMAGLMAAPMVIIELFLMKQMYPNKKRNLVIAAVAIFIMGGFFWGIRQQAAITDKEFLQSMIPHHASAILMCEKAQLTDAETQELCQDIITGQQTEIDQMKAKLEALGQ